MGTTHILCVADGIPPRYPNDYNYKVIRVYDLPTVQLSKYFTECISYIHNALKSGGTVLVHCHAGVSRSATMVIAYLMKYHNMEFEQAFHFVKSKRNVIFPNAGFCR